MPTDQLGPVDDEVLMASFVGVLRAMFPGARWDAVEPHAERAWRGIAWRRYRDWRDVRVDLRSAWDQDKHLVAE